MSLSFLAILAITAAAQSLPPLLVKPGDTVTMPIVVHNIADSNESIDAVRISTTVNSPSIISDPSSSLGPSDISVGGSANFSWTVTISPSAPSGVYRATSRALSASSSVQSADGIDETTQVLIVQADVIAPTAKVLLEESSGSADGTSGSASVVVEYGDNEALDKVVLWLDGVAVSTHLLGGKNVKDTFTLDVTAAVSPPARYTLYVYDKTGNSGVQNFELALGGGGVSVSKPFGSGPGTYESPVIDYGGGIVAVLGAQPSGPWSGGTSSLGSSDINFVEGGVFTTDTETHIGSVSCEYGTSDTPDGVAYSNFGQFEVYYKSLTGEFRNVGSGGSITPWKRFQGSKITVSATGNPLPNQISIRCDDGTDNCGNPTPHYIYLSGNFYPDGAGCGQNGTGVVLRVDRNTYLGRNSAVSTDFAQVTFDSVTYGGRTSAYIIPDAEPTGGRIRLETSAYVSGPSVSTISFSALIPPGVSQARLNAITVETVSGAPATLISTGASSAVLLLSLGSSLVTGVIGEYHITIPPDSTPPSPPTNLMAHKQSNGSVQLTFNAPIDDGFTGQADHLRLEIDRNGVPYRFISIPAGSGGAFQQYQTDILPPGNYNFKLHGVDELGAPSSNVTASVYTPVDYGGGGFVGDQRQATLSSGQSFAANIVSQDDSRLSAFQQAAAAFGANVVTVGGIFEVVSPDTQLSGPASLTARFSSAEAVAQGIDPASLSLVRLSSDTLVSVAQNIGAESITVDITTVTAELYAIVGMVSVFPDTTAPTSQLSFPSDAIVGMDGIISAYHTTLFSITAEDASIAGSSTTGVGAIVYYLDVPTSGDPLDILASTSYMPVTYGGPFSIAPGTHTIGYFSVDGVGNMEQMKFASVSVPLQTDLLPPRSKFIVGNPSTSISSATVTYVSSTSLLGFIVPDDSLEVNDGLGVGATQTFYAVDGAAYERFTSSFNLVVEGAHSLSFYSIDVVGNEETPSQQSIFVDLTPPVTQLNQNGTEMSLSAFDASIAGGASGVARIRYLIDFNNPDVCNNVVADTSGARGTCENPWYAGPFTLSNGPHTLSFQAFDAVGNAEVLRSSYLFVEAPGSGSSAGGMGIGKDPLDTFWTAIAEKGAISFANSDSSGTLISSSTLLDAVEGFPWSVLFDSTGRAYAIGGAAGPGTQALDLAVYKASSEGGAVESRILFDSGYANNDIAFDAKSPGWIVGAAQTSGPTDLEAAGVGEFSMALWRFDPSLGTIQLKTTSARASFDLGAGLAVDPDGSLWIIGYSLKPEAPEMGGFDLALWHYAADGQTLLGGPFLRPGYLDNLDGGLTARVLATSQAVYVAAPRRNGFGGTDMAFLRYDKTSGQPTSEHIWRSANGDPAYPIAVLPEASGLLVAGGIGGKFTEAGLWRFGFDGALQSATKADAGGATGAVFRGAELWLSVDGSTTPYRVLTETPADGALIDVKPPRTTLAGGDRSAVVDSTLYVASASVLGFTTADDKFTMGDGLGVGTTQTFYAADGGAYARFAAGFSLTGEGLHSVSFYSIDLEGNAEAPMAKTVGVDNTAPTAALAVSGTSYALSANDPVVNGAAAGVARIAYLVDADPGSCDAVVPNPAAAPGTCANLLYMGPFALAPGTHTVYFAAVDKVGNGEDSEVVSSSFVTVAPPVAAALTVTGIEPASGTSGKSVSATVTGTGMNASVALTIERADVERGTWTPTGSFAQARFQGTITKLLDGRVLLAGGTRDGLMFPDADIYDPTTGSWTAAAPMNNRRSQFGAVLLADGRVLVTGGQAGVPIGRIATAEIYSSTANAWHAVAPMSKIRAGHQLVLLPDGKVLAAGGSDASNVAQSSAEIYDPASNTWSSAGSMSAARTLSISAALNDGKVLVAGGGNNSGFISSADIYDPATNSWKATGPMSKARGSFQAVKLPNGRVLVSGGRVSSVFTNTAETYDPTTENWTATGPMVEAIADHAMILVNGTPLVIGGVRQFTATNILATTEIYDASINAWRPGPGLVAARRYPLAVTLDDGRVLAAMGLSASALNTAELLRPPVVKIAAGGVSATGSTSLSGTFDLAGATEGAWDVVVREPEGRIGRLQNGFRVLPPPPSLLSLVLAPATVTVRTALSSSFTATGFFSNGTNRVFSGSELNWSTDAPTIATVTAGGVATGLSGGTAHVIATSGPVTGQATIIVSSLQTLILSPASATVAAGQSASFSASGIYTDGSTRAFTTAELSWSSDAPAIAAMTAGVGTGLSAGVARVSATSGTVTGQAIVTVTTPVTITSIAPDSGAAGDIIPTAVAGTCLDSSASLTIERADVQRGTWTPTGSFAQARFLGTITKLRDGRVLLTGGYRDGTMLPDSDIYDPATGLWTAATPMINRRSQFGAVLLADGRVLVTGGQTGAGRIAAAEIYSSSANTWTVVAPMGRIRAGHQLVLLSNGKVLAAGGSDALNAAQSNAEVYDPASNTWSPAGNMNAAREAAVSAVLNNGKVLVFGGANDSGWMATADLYDPASNSWTATGAMSKVRGHCQAVKLNDGRVLVSGGTSPNVATNTSEAYDPTTGTWAETGPMVEAISQHAMVLVNGTPLIIGGVKNFTAYPYLVTTEIYDVATNIWRAGPNLVGMRSLHLAVTLNDERVLTASGNAAAGGSGLNTAELLTAPMVNIPASDVSATGSTSLSGTFALGGAAPGAWDVVVREPEGRIGRLQNGFRVLNAPPTAVVDLALTEVFPSSVTLRWTAPVVSAPSASYDLRRSSFPITADSFASATPVAAPAVAAAGATQTLTVSGIEGSFYAALVTRNADGPVSPMSNVAGVTRSTVTVNGGEELTFSANQPVTQVLLSTEEGLGSVVLASAAPSGMLLVSSIYDLGPEGAIFEPAAQLTIRFSDAEVAALGVSPADLRIYQYVAGSGWVEVASQTLDLNSGSVTASIPSLHSIFALFAKPHTAPALALSPPQGSTVTTATPAIAAAYSALGFGVDPGSVRLGLDGFDVTTMSVIGASSAAFTPVAPLAQGGHIVTAQVADFAGNHSSGSASFFLDSIPPLTSLLLDGLAASATNLILVSTDAIGFSAFDAGGGAALTRFALDGGAESPYVSTFSVSVGTHTLAYRSFDQAGNLEETRNAMLVVLALDTAPPDLTLMPPNGSTVTTATPPLIASYADAGWGIDASSLRLNLDGVNAPGEAVVTTSSATFVSPTALGQGTHTFTASIMDLAGNASTASAAFFVDSLPPVTTLSINGLAAGSTSLVLSSTDLLRLDASDAGSGVLETLYTLDQAAEAVFLSTFTLNPGRRTLSFRSRDLAGNVEAVRNVVISVSDPFSDTLAPLVRLDYPAAGLGVETAVGGAVSVRGQVSDSSAVAWTLETAPGASATSGFTAVSSGQGNASGLLAAWNTASLSGDRTLRLRATDAFGNSSSATVSAYVGGPVLTFSAGRKDANVIVSRVKNPTGIAVRADGSVWVASADDNVLILLSPAGAVLAEADYQFKSPQGLTLDAAGSLYVADRVNDRVVKLSADGSRLLLQIAKVNGKGKSKTGTAAADLLHPQDVAVDGNGEIYVADAGNQRIAVFDAAGAFLRQFGAGVLLSTSEVRGIALTSEGLWVSDKEAQGIQLFSREGAWLKAIGDADSVVGEISRNRGLAADRFGALYAIEPNRDRVQKFDPRGKGLLAFGSKAGLSRAEQLAKAYLTQPIDAALAPDGSIWITDSGRDRVVRYALPSAGYSAAALAAGGRNSSPGSAEPARRTVDARDGAEVSRDDGAGVSVPKGALAADLEITVEAGDANADKEQKDAGRMRMKVAAVSEEVQYGPEGTTFAVPVTLILPYDPNLIAARGIDESQLKVYYWNPGMKDWQAMPSTVDKQNKTVSARTSHFSAYQVQGPGAGVGVAAAVDDFGLRDGYAFPNPSRGGAAVSFRLQPGLADSVEVRVYDLSGRKVHASSDFRFGILDDGNGKGAQNTYDHAWDVSGVGSGVYTFVMTARKAGQTDIRKTGKVGIVK